MQTRNNGQRAPGRPVTQRNGRDGGAPLLDDEVLRLVTQETNNALHVILAEVALLQMAETARTDEEAASLDSIRLEAIRLERTVATLAALSRLRSVPAGGPTTTDMETVIPFVIERVGQMWPSHNILIENHAGRVEVLSEAEYVERLLENLLFNAARFSDAVAPIEMTVRADDLFAEVAVRDFGMALPTGHIGEIFEPYFRAPLGEREAPGMGFELRAAQHIVELHGGTMSSGAAPGGGSVFRFTLPLAKEMASHGFERMTESQQTD